jgi:hypothetical protein
MSSLETKQGQPERAVRAVLALALARSPEEHEHGDPDADQEYDDVFVRLEFPAI